MNKAQIAKLSTKALLKRLEASIHDGKVATDASAMLKEIQKRSRKKIETNKKVVCKHCGMAQTNKVCCPNHPIVIAATQAFIAEMEKDNMVAGIKKSNAKRIGTKIGLPPIPAADLPKPVAAMSADEVMRAVEDIVINSCSDFDLELERAYLLLDRLRAMAKIKKTK